jgi:NTE family protein
MRGYDSASMIAEPRPRVGLVLGGGGAVGAAYHAGVLAALEHDLAWDPGRADIIVGTSAGALVGTMLRLGVRPSDLAAIAVGAHVRHADRDLVRRLVDRPSFPPLTLRHLARLPRWPKPSMAAGLVALWTRRGVSSLASLAMLLPEGDEVLMPHLDFIDDAFDAGWPDDPLLLCAVRRRDSRRVVFGPGGTVAPLKSAVAASCAVPGYFADVQIDGVSYVDGGVISATNADVLCRNKLDLVVIVSPMTGEGGRRSVAREVRRFCRRALDREIRSLARCGIPTVVIEPGATVLQHMTTDFMSDTASVEIVRQAFLETGAQVARDPRLRALSQRTKAVSASPPT